MYRSLVTAASLTLATSAFAADTSSKSDDVLPVTFVEDTGDVIRIESAEYLRTYSQEVAAAACFYYNDIAADFSRELLIEARDGFDLRVDALLNGNDSLGIIGGEQRRKTIARIGEISAIWEDIGVAVDALLEDAQDTNAVGVIKSKNLELFDATDILVTEIEAQYANPSIITQADVLTLEIVGRQAMMTQKIAKNACKIFTGNETQKIKDDLSGSVGIYEASLNALINGMPELGLRAAPTPEIEAALVEIKSDWASVRPILDTLTNGGAIDRDTQIFLFKHMVEEMVRLEEVSHAYAENAKYES